MSEQTVDFAQVVSIIVALIGVLGTFISALFTARFALRNYQKQKVADRDYYRHQKDIDRQVEATKNRAQSYKDYLTAYANVQAWPGGDDAVYAKLYDEYYDAYHNVFQIAGDNVFRATTAFHQIAWLERIPDGGEERTRHIEEWKKRYAQMLIEMRTDAFEKTDLSVDEIAKRLPWVWGDEATANGRATGSERSVEAHDEKLGTPTEGNGVRNPPD